MKDENSLTAEQMGSAYSMIILKSGLTKKK